MKALFLAGGKGLRLQPLTNHLPKPMVPIMNKPLLERTMTNLKKSGITQIVISSCYQPQFIKNYFGNGERFGLEIKYIVEDKPLGTGGAIKKAGYEFNDSFIVFNADILSDIDIDQMFDLHRSSNALATIATTQVENPSAYGVIESDENGYALSFVEKPSPESNACKSINAGIYIFEPEVLNAIPIESVVSVERETFPGILENGGKIAVYNSSCYWMDIGTIKKYLQAHADIMSGKCNLVDCKLSLNSIAIGKNTRIHPDCKFSGQVYIGDNVVMGAKTTISNSVIGNNVSIGSASTIVGSIVWNGICLNSKANLFETVVTENPVVLKKTYALPSESSSRPYDYTSA